MVIVHGSVIGERRQRNVGPRHREHRDRKHPIQPADRGRRVHRLGEGEEDRHADGRSDRGDQKGVRDDAGLRLLRIGQKLREPASQAQGGNLRAELDHQDSISEASEGRCAINPAGDEQERDPGHQPEHEAEDVEATAARQGRHVGIRRAILGRRSVFPIGQCAAPQCSPQPTSTSSGTSSACPGSAARPSTSLITAAASSSRPSGTSNTSSSWT